MAGQGALRGGFAEAPFGLVSPAGKDPALGGERTERGLNVPLQTLHAHLGEHAPQRESGVAP